MKKIYTITVHKGKYGPVSVKSNHPQHLPLFWIKPKTRQ